MLEEVDLDGKRIMSITEILVRAWYQVRAIAGNL